LTVLHVFIGSSLDSTPLTTLQVCVRGLTVLGSAALVGVAARRFPSEAAPTTDMILGVTLGSAMAAMINAPSPIIAIVTCVILLVLGYRLTRRIFGPDRLSGGGDLDEATPVPLGRSGDIGVVSRR
jgi:uncharacterized membrane protein